MTPDTHLLLAEPRTLLIFCDGGLANRVNSLIGGLVLAERLGRPHKILWPRNNRCGAAFDQIFESSGAGPEVLDIKLQDLLPHQAQLQLWLHENDVGFAQPVQALRQLDANGALAVLASADERAILYCENTVLRWLPDADVARAVLGLRFAPGIVARARALLAGKPGQGAGTPPAQPQADGLIGIHLRATDFTSPPPTDAMLATVQANPGTRFFVCSDDAALEARFAALPNVLLHSKQAYVEKRSAGPWRALGTDSDGLPYGSNIERSAHSVVDAAVDLLVLATSVPVRTSGSSFLALAERLRKTGWVGRHFGANPPPATATAQAPLPAQAISQQDIISLLGLVRPRQMVTDHKVRIGADGDGGYVMPSLALKSTAVLSIGIGDQVSFDIDLAERGATVLQFDHTIAGAPQAHPRVTFNRLGWAAHDAGDLRSLHTMMQGIDWARAEHPVLKFDTEGAEWDALAAADPADLARFDVIAGEFHGFHNLAVPSVYHQIHAVLSKLRASHVPVHLHANNATGIRLVLGVPVPPLMEITWVRKDAVATAGPCTEPIPGPLDRPNMADRPDICLRPF